MQLTGPNVIRRPGVRLHPKACAALGLEAERATPKRLGTLVPRTCIHALGTGYARKSGEPLSSAQRRGRAQARGHTLSARQARHAGGDQPSRCCMGPLCRGPTVSSSGMSAASPLQRGASSCSSQGNPRGNHGAPLHDRVHLPTYLPLCSHGGQNRLHHPSAPHLPPPGPPHTRQPRGGHPGPVPTRGPLPPGQHRRHVPGRPHHCLPWRQGSLPEHPLAPS